MFTPLPPWQSQACAASGLVPASSLLTEHRTVQALGNHHLVTSVIMAFKWRGEDSGERPARLQCPPAVLLGSTSGEWLQSLRSSGEVSMESRSLGITVQTHRVWRSSSHPLTQPGVFWARFPGKIITRLSPITAVLDLACDAGSLAGQELPSGQWRPLIEHPPCTVHRHTSRSSGSRVLLCART